MNPLLFMRSLASTPQKSQFATFGMSTNPPSGLDLSNTPQFDLSSYEPTAPGPIPMARPKKPSDPLEATLGQRFMMALGQSLQNASAGRRGGGDGSFHVYSD